MIKAVTFDLDGVYFTGQSFSDFMTNLPKEETDMEKVNYVLKKSPEMTNFKSGKMTEEEYWEYVRRELRVTVDNNGIFEALRNSYEVNPEVKNYVLEIKAKGLKTCICSNNFVTRVRELESKFGFLKDFDVKVFSHEVGIMKPDKRIFEELVKQAGVKPEEIVYSDDDESKLQGAMELGINAFVYRGFKDFKKRVDGLLIE